MHDNTISIDDLIREHYSYILRLAVSILNNQDDADDAAQKILYPRFSTFI